MNLGKDVLKIFEMLYSIILFLGSSLEGYVHLLSKVRSARNTTTNFFDCRIQTGTNEVVRAVCYSPPKHVNLQQAYQNKSPIKITGVKSTPNKRYHTDSEEYAISKYAKITPSAVEFAYNDSLSNKLCSVSDALKKDVYESMDLKVKVVKKEESNQVIVKNQKSTYKCHCIVADKTNSIKLALWESCIDAVHTGKSYHIQTVTVRIFYDTKFLNTNESTVINEIDDIKDMNLTSSEIQDKLFKGKVIAVHIKSTASCLMCNTAIDVTVDEETITCECCKMTYIYI